MKHKLLAIFAALMCSMTVMAGEKVVYTVFDGDQTLTYYYDDQYDPENSYHELYDPVNAPDAVRFTDYYEKVNKAVIDPSMKNALLKSTSNMFFGGTNSGKFQSLSNMTAIEGLQNLNTAQVTDMSGMFYACYTLQSLDLSTFNTSQVTDMSGMFYACNALQSLDLSAFNTALVRNMSNMFYGCYTLQSLDLSGFNTAQVTDMSNMFFGCIALQSLNVSSFVTARVTDMRQMFYTCKALQLLDLSSFVNTQVTDMYAMFYNCQKLESIDLSLFDNSNAKELRNMFKNCLKLKTIKCNNDWSIDPEHLASKEMFYGCTELVGGEGTLYDEAVTDVTYARPDGGTAKPGYFTTGKPAVVEPPASLESDYYFFKAFNTYTKEYDTRTLKLGFFGVNQVYIQGLSDYLKDSWVMGTREDNVLTIPKTYLGIYDPGPGSSDLYFSGAIFDHNVYDNIFTSDEGYVSYVDVGGQKLYLDEYSNVQLTKVSDFAAMPVAPKITGFITDCDFPIVKIDIPTEDVNSNPLFIDKLSYKIYVEKDGAKSPLTFTNALYKKLESDMTEIPYGYCDNYDFYKDYIYLKQPLEELLSWTKIGIQSIYKGGDELNATEIQWFSIPKVYTVFDGDQTLTYYYDDQYDLSNPYYEIYDPINAPDAIRFTGYYDKVKKAVIDTSMKEVRLTSMRSMFDGGENSNTVQHLAAMTTISGLKNLNTAQVTDMSRMFYYCNSLRSLDLSGFNTAQVTDMNQMFYGCKALQSLDLSAFNTAKVTDMSKMFFGCLILQSLDVSSFVTTKVADMNWMFDNCRTLQSLDLSSFVTDKTTQMFGMFSSCQELESLDLSMFDVSKTDIREMFKNCLKLTTIICNNDWSVKCTQAASKDMFLGCTALIGSEGTTYDEEVTDVTYARPDGGIAKPGYFTKDSRTLYTAFDGDQTLTYYFDDKYDVSNPYHEIYDPINAPDAERFTNYYKKIKKVVIDASMKDAHLTSTRSMFFGGINGETYAFQGLLNMTVIEGIQYLNTANVTNMNSMFLGCNKLEILNLTSFNVSNVTDMQYMFNSCYALKTIYCNDNWSKSTTLEKSGYMFNSCNALVGGKGTVYDSEKTDVTYARPDDLDKNLGYFTSIIFGDADGDTKVDVNDVTSTINYILNKPVAKFFFEAADMDKDGKIDVNDVQAIIYKALGKD